MEQNFNPGLALIGLSGTRPRVLKMTGGLDLGAVPTSNISCREISTFSSPLGLTTIFS